MRALEPEVVDAVWQAVEALLPSPLMDEHPLGCHRSRVPDRVCFEGILIRLVTGCAWVDVEQLLGRAVSDTTLRGRRDEWLAAGVFDALAAEALAAYDRIISLDLSECAVVGSQHKAPAGGQGTGPSPVDRGKRGWKWSLFADRNGIPLGWATDGANRHDTVLLEPTLATVTDRGLLADCETLHLDRGYDNRAVRRLIADAGIEDLICSKVRPAGTALAHRTDQLVVVELRTAPPQHRPAQRAPPRPARPRHRPLLTAKLIDWRNRWEPDMTPIRARS
jgi:transposase